MTSRARTLDQRQEQEIAALVPGGELTPSSGRIREKLDVTTKPGPWMRFVYSCKETQGKSISVTHALWEEAREGAYGRSPELRPALALRLHGPSRSTVTKTSIEIGLVAVDENDWAELLETESRQRQEIAELRARLGDNAEGLT